MSGPEPPAGPGPTPEPPRRGGDLVGHVTDGRTPPKTVTLFFSRRVWIAVISFLALTMIGGVIEYAVQTPLSKFVDGLVGPRPRTLEKALRAGQYGYVYSQAKGRFMQDPQKEPWRRLFVSGSEGLMRDLVSRNEWEKAVELLEEIGAGMPTLEEHRVRLIRLYLEAQPERFRLFIERERGPDGPDRLWAIWEEAQRVADRAPDDAGVALAAGRALAHLSWRPGQYNLGSIRWFEKALNLDPALAGDPVLEAVIREAMSEGAFRPEAELARRLVANHLLPAFEKELRESLQVRAFAAGQFTEEERERYRRQNAHWVLAQTKRLSGGDEFRAQLLAVAHAGWSDEDLVAAALAYFRALERARTFGALKDEAALPEIVPAGSLTLRRSDYPLKETWALISGPMRPIFRGYCAGVLKQAGIEDELRKNCAALTRPK